MYLHILKLNMCSYQILGTYAPLMQKRDPKKLVTHLAACETPMMELHVENSSQLLAVTNKMLTGNHYKCLIGS